jgi:hypothetical protein
MWQLFISDWGRGSVEPEKRGEEQQERVKITKLGLNNNMTECTQEISSL